MSLLSCSEVQYVGEQSSGTKPSEVVLDDPLLLQVECSLQRPGDKLVLATHDGENILTGDYLTQKAFDPKWPRQPHKDDDTLAKLEVAEGSALHVSANGFPASEKTLAKVESYEQSQGDEEFNNSTKGKSNFQRGNSFFQGGHDLSNGISETEISRKDENNKEITEQVRETELVPFHKLQQNLDGNCLKEAQILEIEHNFCSSNDHVLHVAEEHIDGSCTSKKGFLLNGTSDSHEGKENNSITVYESSGSANGIVYEQGISLELSQDCKTLPPSEELPLSTKKVGNNVQDINQESEGGLLVTESPEEEHAVALWVKWRGKWQTGIQCPRADCPLQTLRAKPTHERKKYLAIFFPRTRTYSWADMLLVRPIDEFPEPLVYGTHRRWKKLVRDLTIPRRYIMQKLAVAMINISEQLHTEAVVEHAQKATTWKEFAIEASYSTNYLDLGRMLLKLQTMILPGYISQHWLEACFNSWFLRCQTAKSAESVEILTEELFNSVLWNRVEELWSAPIQPDLGPEWKTWKQEVMKYFSAAFPRAGKGDLEQRNDDNSMIVRCQPSSKRPKLEVRRAVTYPTNAAGLNIGSQDVLLDANSVYLKCQSFAEYTPVNEPQANANPGRVTVADTGSGVAIHSEIPAEGKGIQVVPTSQLLANRTTAVNLHHVSDTMKYRQCSAFIEAKGRQCGRWANDGDVYCCVHLNFRPVGKLYHQEQKPPVEQPMCEGKTTHGNKCKHRARYGSSFCKKHSFQDTKVPMDCDITLDSSAYNLKRKHDDSAVVNQFPNSIILPKEQFSCPGEVKSSMPESLIPVMVEETLDERNCLMNKSELRCALPSIASGTSVDSPLCIGYYVCNNSEQCLEIASKYTLYCEKHLPKFLKRARDGKCRLISKDVFLDLLRNCSSRKEKLHLHQACELLYGFMKSNVSRQKSVSKEDSMRWILSEASMDQNVGEFLLKLVSREREKIASVWGFDGDKVKRITPSKTIGQTLVLEGSCSDIAVRCKICDQKFSDDQKLGIHWTDIHKKEARWLFRGFACAICMNSFTNRKVLETHIKERHGMQFLEHSILFRCMSCNSHFVTPDQLWEHVLAFHSSDFCMQNLSQQQDDQPGVDLGCNPSLDKGDFEKNIDSRRFVCRFCGLRFDLLPDLGRHHQVAHMSHLASKKGNNCLTHSTDFYSKSDKTFSAAVRIEDRSNLRNKFQSSKSAIAVRAMLQTQTSDTAILGRLLESHCSDVASTLFNEFRKAKPRPSNRELISIAQTACCRTSLHSALEIKYGTLPENIYLKAAKLCSELNIPVDWHLEGFICYNGCKPVSKPDPLPPLNPLPDGFINLSPTMELMNDSEWERDEYHYILDSKNFTVKPIQKPIILCEDLSFGKEPVPVPCVLDADIKNMLPINTGKLSCNEELGSYMPWQDFVYVTQRLIDPLLGLDTENSQLGCTCSDFKCNPKNCDHVYLFDNDYEDAVDIYGEAMHNRFPYDEKGRNILEEGHLVYECNSMCNCDSSCPNRVLQRGVQVKLEVFRTEKGWAVRAAEAIPRGTFVCEYIGEVLSNAEANKRHERSDTEGCSYLYDIDAHIDGTRGLSKGMVPYVIDATKYGNVARFINHSCSPNLVNYFVLVESMDCQLAHIGLYASRNISIGEELAYDNHHKLQPGDGRPCHCGAPICQGRLY